MVKQDTLRATVLLTEFLLLKVKSNFIHLKTREIEIILVSPMVSRSGPSGRSTPGVNFTTTAVGIRLRMIHLVLGDAVQNLQFEGYVLLQGVLTNTLQEPAPL